MIMCQARRAFLAGTVLSTGSLSLLGSLAAAGEDEDEQQAAIDAAVRKCRDEQSRRQMADRARYFKRFTRRLNAFATKQRMPSREAWALMV